MAIDIITGEKNGNKIIENNEYVTAQRHKPVTERSKLHCAAGERLLLQDADSSLSFDRLIDNDTVVIARVSFHSLNSPMANES